MKLCKLCYLYVLLWVFCITTEYIDAKPAVPIHSDVVETTGLDRDDDPKEMNKPGWMRRQLLIFGRVASRVGNSMGAHATKVTIAVEKICEIVKTIVPVLAAVCTVGQFKFCAATNDAPEYLADAIAPTTLNLNEPDK